MYRVTDLCYNQVVSVMLPRAIVLAGGASRRFGSDKALADMGGRNLVELIVDDLLAVFAKVFVVTKHPTALGLVSSDRLRLIHETHPARAALVGIMEGLRHTDRTLNYVTGCDMPGVAPHLIAELYRLARGADCALRCDEAGQVQPLGGFYSTRALPKIERLVAEERFRITEALDELKTHVMPFETVARLDPELRSFWNVNTPDDLAGLAGLLT